METAADLDWGPPDQDGVRSRYTNKSRTGRVRRAGFATSYVGTLLGEERTLVLALLARGGLCVRSKTVFALAGNLRHVAIDAVNFLLRNGWAEVSERRPRSDWQLLELRWIDPEGLRSALGLETKAAHASRRADLLRGVPTNEKLLRLHESLSGLGGSTLPRRSALVAALEAWSLDQRSGTRVQFALFATGNTKAITASDWIWVEKHVRLEEVGISQHTPSLVIRGPIILGLDGGTLDLRAVPDLISLTPDTITAVRTVKGIHRGWLLVENRTSFEDVARRMGDTFVVVWMPGFVADWWLSAMRHLVALSGGPAYIAADPDPAGIEIALRASTPWKTDWQPWAMSAEDLERAGQGKPLTADDVDRVQRIKGLALPETLAALMRAIERSGRKAEQESLDLPALLPAAMSER